MRFRKSIKLAPGIRMNLSGSGVSWTLGPRGASIGIGKRGTFLNTGLPGTGLYSRDRIGGGSGTPAPVPSASTTFQSSITLNDDGSLLFKDEAGNPLADYRIDLIKKQKGNELRGFLQSECDKINAQIEALGEIHHYTPDPKIPPRYERHPFNLPPPVPPIPKRHGFLAKLFKGIAARIDTENQSAVEEFQSRLAIWQQKKAEFDAGEYARERHISRVAAGDVPAMEEFFGEVLNDIVWPRETLVSFEVSDDATQISLSVDLPELHDMPSKTASAPQRGFKLSIKDMGPTWVQKLYMRHVHAIGFRLIGEAFAMLPTLTQVTLSAYSQRANKSTGQIADEYLYSVRVLRADWECSNFANLPAIDVVETFTRFELRRDMSKTGVFKPGTPFS